MRNIAVLLILAPILSFGQYFGHNGSNTPENLNETTIQWLTDMVQPGQTWTYRFRADKYDGPVPETVLASVVDLHEAFEDAGKHMAVIYDFHVRGNSAADNLVGFNYLQDAGVNIVAVQFGNEEFSEQNFNWQAYEDLFTPTLEALSSFNGDRLFFAAPRPANSTIAGGRRDHNNWDEALKTFLAGKPASYAVAWHIYYNGRNCPVLDQLLGQFQYTGAYMPTIDSLYREMWECMLPNDHWDATYNYILTNFPDRHVWITEFGPPSATGDLQNTLAIHMAEFNTWQLNKYRFTSICKHNGLTSEWAGIISSKKSPDSESDSGYVRRMSYWTYMLFRESEQAVPYSPGLTLSTGTHQLWYINDTNEDLVASFSAETGPVASQSTRFIQGNTFYSSSGATAWMARGSAAGLEVTGISTGTGLPAMSFGYITITIGLQVEDPNPPCKRPWWCALFPRGKRCNC